MLSSVYSAVQWGEHTRIQSMNFLLINGCGTRENNIRGHSFFEVALVSSPNIRIVTNKDCSNKKSKEARAFIYTCRYSIVDIFNPL